jgi:hypothetical protein
MAEADDPFEAFADWLRGLSPDERKAVAVLGSAFPFSHSRIGF